MMDRFSPMMIKRFRNCIFTPMISTSVQKTQAVQPTPHFPSVATYSEIYRIHREQHVKEYTPVTTSEVRNHQSRSQESSAENEDIISDIITKVNEGKILDISLDHVEKYEMQRDDSIERGELVFPEEHSNSPSQSRHRSSRSRRSGSRYNYSSRSQSHSKDRDNSRHHSRSHRKYRSRSRSRDNSHNRSRRNHSRMCVSVFVFTF